MKYVDAHRRRRSDELLICAHMVHFGRSLIGSIFAQLRGRWNPEFVRLDDGHVCSQLHNAKLIWKKYSQAKLINQR